MNIKATVYCDGRYYYTDDIDISSINITSDYYIGNIQDRTDYLDIFRQEHIVPDVWRYTIKVCNGIIDCCPLIINTQTIKTSDFSDRPAIQGTQIGRKVILLILESPHKSEYDKNPTNCNNLKSKAPAQGRTINDAGGSIENYLNNILKNIKLDNGFYSLLISNPIPYMCSLGIFTTKIETTVRDRVWKEIWKIQSIKNNFINRCQSYKPEYIINCCTNKLQDLVTKEIFNAGFTKNLYTAYHPAGSIRGNNWKDGIFDLKKIITLGR